MSYVFAVESEYDYQLSNVIKVFEDEAEANAFCDLCRKYNESNSFITLDITNSAEVEIYQKEEIAWNNSHPAGPGNAGADYYYVNKIEFVKASTPSKGEPQKETK
tara:strand:- start:5937 stop:6251 length:315 start_codon:yes stop_codon:yes gene_type:complete